ncbi:MULTISPECIES: hypothetical protein [unclassified Novosphingobium]|uniref:hypothetical protein n=1 Tax=unclassified Novosphingobium TaxID=2644732 RepID=UPI000D320045|nr:MULTISPECIES: hypothetical protein [unclassified Novosphingobium]PTR05384.1 hypothetical protein C8K11_13411 [Novosphingobium sp. GV055]PUA93948.1 hypothetical protein C8K12_13411 [Novosphingobium sp. GV061]PUB11365.1 hypothetical protein C8K14_13411 [Novosphingobium sp. GV079]PUB37055.1 hypothetical protein C8K10_13411 [Novosphingobium sp. GV027]
MTREQLDIPMIIFAAVLVVSMLAARACALCGLTWGETVLVVFGMLALGAAVGAAIRSLWL